MKAQASVSTFATHDLNLTAYLLCTGKFTLAGILPKSGPQKEFAVQPAPSEADITAFYSGGGTVSALRLCETLRTLKAAVRTGNAFRDDGRGRDGQPE